jgi:hypothetical protein
MIFENGQENRFTPILASSRGLEQGKQEARQALSATLRLNGAAVRVSALHGRFGHERRNLFRLIPPFPHNSACGGSFLFCEKRLPASAFALKLPPPPGFGAARRRDRVVFYDLAPGKYDR